MSPGDGTHQVRIGMVGFVDNSTGSCNDFRPQDQVSIHTLGKRMEHDAQLWNDILHIPGQALELPKCSFHLLYFEMAPSGKPRVISDPYDDMIHVTESTTGRLIPIPAKGANDSHKTLGHYKAPGAPRQRRQMQEITAKAKKNSILISISPVSRYGATLAYHTIFLASVGYVLPQSFFSKSALSKEQSKVMGSIIAKCGYNRHTASAILYAPTPLAGGGFVHWYVLQGEGQIMKILKHWRTDTLISKTLRIDLAWSQWQAGIGQPILEDTMTPLPYLECRYLKSARIFLADIHAQLRVDETFVQAKERTNDLYIMDFANRSGLFTVEDLTIINYCRLYLQFLNYSMLLETLSYLICSLAAGPSGSTPRLLLHFNVDRATTKSNTGGNGSSATGVINMARSRNHCLWANGVFPLTNIASDGRPILKMDLGLSFTTGTAIPIGKPSHNPMTHVSTSSTGRRPGPLPPLAFPSMY
jgi:hypothetical protein